MNGKEIVVVSGVTRSAGQPKQETIGSPVEIFNFANKTWRNGTALPRNIEEPVLVPYKKTFLIVGGMLLGGARREVTKAIYEYDIANEKWIVRNETLPRDAMLTTGFLIGDTLSGCSDKAYKSKVEI